MAILHEKAGQRLKDQATRYFRRYLLSGFATTGLMMGLVGFLIGRYSFVVGMILLIVPGAVLLWVMHALEKRAEKWAKERIRLLRAGQTEALVAWHLKDLPNSYHVFNNLAFPGGDLDHVVVGPAGLFVVSTKNYRGSFTRNANGAIYRNGAPTDDPRQAMKQAMWLKDRLAESLGGETPWIQPILCAPFVEVRFDGRSNNVWILNDETLLAAIDGEGEKAKLTKGIIDRVVRAVEKLKS